MPIAFPQVVTKQNCLQTLSGDSWGAKLPLVENHSPKERERKLHINSSHVDAQLGGCFLPPCRISQSFTLSTLGEVGVPISTSYGASRYYPASLRIGDAYI